MNKGAVLIASACLTVLTGCGKDELAQPARDHRAVEEVAGEPVPDPGRTRAATEASPRNDDAGTVRRIDGRPMWADSRRYTAVENAAYQFEQHAQELEAKDLEDFLAKAHRFVNDPPTGAKSLVRANGDRLYYDPKSGLFGVAREDGAPRTVFKPRDGEAYWAQQMREAEAAGGSRSAGGGGRS